MSNTRLPSTPSALILLAIGDFRKCLKSKKYKIDMSTWHNPNSQCTVCMAGAVMAGTLNAPPSAKMTPDDYPAVTADKLAALDSFRHGNIVSFVDGVTSRVLSKRQLEIISMIDWSGGCVVSNAQDNKNWRAFIQASLKIADRLEAVRL